MSKYQRSDFPPHWDPPPRMGYGENTPPLLEVLEAVCSNRSRPWVRALFLDKMASYREWLRDDELDRFLTVVETFPEGLEVARDHTESFERILDRGDCTPSQRERIRALLAAVGHKMESSDTRVADP